MRTVMVAILSIAGCAGAPAPRSGGAASSAHVQPPRPGEPAPPGPTATESPGGRSAAQAQHGRGDTPPARSTVTEPPGAGRSSVQRARGDDRSPKPTASEPPAAAAAPPLPAEAMREYRRAEELLATGDHDDAAAVIEPLLAQYPAYAPLRVLECRVALARGGPKDPGAIAVCDRALELAADVRSTLAIAAARRGKGDLEGESAALAAAEQRIANLPPDRAAAAWLSLAEHYRDMEAVTRAENALASAGPGVRDAGIAAWAETIRTRFGLPRDGARWKLGPDDDVAALTAVRDVIAKSSANKLDAAAKAAAAAEKRWPGLPGLLAARCDVELHRGAIAAARQLCARALAQADTSWALYLSGVIELRATGRAATEAGTLQLRKAISIDPDLVQAWQALDRALRRAGQRDELDQLHSEYRARFGAQLPP